MNQDLGYELVAVMPTALDCGLFDSLCTIQQRTNTVGPTGQPDLTDWVDIPTLTGLECMLSLQRPFVTNQSATVRTPQQFDTETEVHILLQGYYPQILQQNQAVVDGIPYMIMGVESDSQKRQTRLAARVYTL